MYLAAIEKTADAQNLSQPVFLFLVSLDYNFLISHIQVVGGSIWPFPIKEMKHDRPFGRLDKIEKQVA